MPMYDSNRPKAYDCFNEIVLANPERLVSIDAAISCVRLEQSQVVDEQQGCLQTGTLKKVCFIFNIQVKLYVIIGETYMLEKMLKE